MANINTIIAIFDNYLEETGKPYLTAIEGNRLLERSGLLHDSYDRPGQPLRVLLRDGLIQHAYQPAGKGGKWYIPHSRDSQIDPDQKNPPSVTKPNKEVKLNKEGEEAIKIIKKDLRNARNKYKPSNIKCLLIAEAPPNSLDRFFYYDDVREHDWLFLGVTEVLYPDLKKNYLDLKRPKSLKKKILKEFRIEGYYLMDLLEIPIDLYTEPLYNAIPDLIHRIKNLIELNTPIILIKTPVFDIVYSRLIDAKFKKVSSIRIPFPVQGGQKEFRIKFKDALDSFNLIESKFQQDHTE